MRHFDSNFQVISARFATRRGRFDYEGFFGRLVALRGSNDSNEVPSSRAASILSASNQPPTKRRAASSPTKREQRAEKSRPDETYSSESDVQPAESLSKMRVDRLLEIQQQLQASVRKKLLLGMTGGRRDGYLGVEDTLFQLDPDGDGFLPLRAFTDNVLARLKVPLTKTESDFFLAQLQARGKVSEEKGVDYEQLRLLFDIDSEDSASECDVGSAGYGAASCPSPTRLTQLGAEYLAAEKKLSTFLRGSMSPKGSAATPTTAFDTPRSIYTGAERFLELAEAVDTKKTGKLDEKCFGAVLAKCGIDIPEHLVSSMLSRFPREETGRVSYFAFLHHYGQNPEQARGRRELKERAALLVSRVRTSVLDWIAVLRQRFRAYDATLEESKRGALVQPEFLRILSRHCESTQVPADQAAPISRVLARLSPDKLVRYREFLQLLSECSMHTPKSLDSDTVKPVDAKSGVSISVGDYLMSLATSQERRNFEQLMDLLNAFQQQIASPTADGVRTTTQPIPNGIELALGQKLKVQVQFRL